MKKRLLFPLICFLFLRSLPQGSSEPKEQRSVNLSKPATQTQMQKYINLFGEEMWISCIIGAAEGTRHTDCSKNPAYYGHEDPSDKLWNLGSFSFSTARFGLNRSITPEEADKIYAEKLKKGGKILQAQLNELQIQVDPLVILNAFDLLNQSPLAAVGDECNPGFLKQYNDIAYARKDLSLEKKIISARVNSFFGCSGNLEIWCKTEACAYQDQGRRYEAVNKAYKSILKRYGSPSS